MIERLRVVGFKTLQDVELSFGRLTVVIGANSAGKSNLLDAVSLLGAIGSSSTLADAFENQRGTPIEAFSFGEGGVQGLLDQPKVQLHFDADIRLSPAVVRSINRRIRDAREGLDSARALVRYRYLRYSIDIEMLTETGLLRVADESLRALNKDGSNRQSRPPFFSKTRTESGRAVLRLRMERQSRPTDSDVGMDRSVVSMPLYEPHFPHVSALREEFARWQYYYLEPRAMREDSPLREVTRLPPDGSDLAAFYNTLRQNSPKRFDGVRRAARLILPDIEDIHVDRTPDGLLQLSVTENGIRFPASALSEGTLRILALLAITNSDSPSSVVGYEEPENGVHPVRLSLIAALFQNAADTSETQFIVNTHSPVLPQEFKHAKVMACHKRRGRSGFEELRLLPLLAEQDLSDVLNDPSSARGSISDRMIRGEFV